MRIGIHVLLIVLYIKLISSPVSASDLSADGMPYDHAATSPITLSSVDKVAGEKVYMDKGCIECHGPRGYSEDPDMFPKIAGLEQQYIVDQLLAFQSGRRQNVIMSPVAITLTVDEIAAVAAFISARR
jgi:cytochrome c553